MSSLPDLVNENSNEENQNVHTYDLKWIQFRNKQCAIITQNENGPCPLLAILNVLLLRDKISLPLDLKSIKYNEIIEFLVHCILENRSRSTSEDYQLDYEQNIQDAMSLFPKLHTGLDVNVRFSSITSFEYTSELIIFDLLSIPLYHGWIVDKDDTLTCSIVENYSYNQLVDKIITKKSSDKEEDVNEALIAENFLEKTASQLTYYGLFQLINCVKEQELSILFRNNHFITLYKNQNQLYQLVTDQGFLNEPEVVWMTLNNIDNDDIFVDHEFKPISPKTNLNNQKNQIDQDYLIALSIEEDQKKQFEKMNDWSEYKKSLTLMNLNDEELARKLQYEEEQEYNKFLNDEKKKNLNLAITDSPNSDINYEKDNSQSSTRSNNFNNQNKPCRICHVSNQVSKSTCKCEHYNHSRNKQNCTIL